MPRRRGLAQSFADTLIRCGECAMTVDHLADEFRPDLMAPGRILVIDDEQAIRAALGRALTAEGHAVDFAETGSDGLGQALARSYDLVILDLLMPDTDGRSVLRQLLRDRPAQAVMVLSCLAEVNCKVDCLELGARDYLTKPFSLAALLARVHTQLRAEGLGTVILAGMLKLHLGRMEADIRHGPIPLTRLEFLHGEWDLARPIHFI